MLCKMIIELTIGTTTVLRIEVSAIHTSIGTTGIDQNHAVETEKYDHSTEVHCCL